MGRLRRAGGVQHQPVRQLTGAAGEGQTSVVVIRDVAGDLYYVASPDDLDARSRKWLWAFVD